MRFLPERTPLLRISLVWLALLPACGGGGGGGGSGINPEFVPDPLTSQFRVTPSFGTPADGNETVRVVAQINNRNSRPIAGAVVELVVSGFGNEIEALPPTDATGLAVGRISSLVGERKVITARVRKDTAECELGPIDVVFLQIPEDTFFVRQSGSDSNTGRTPLVAWQTIEHALSQVGPGATIHVGAGVYPAQRITLDSNRARPLTLRADLQGLYTGDAGAVVIDATGGPTAVEISGASGVVLCDFDLRGARPGDAPGGAVRIQDSNWTWILDCHAYDSDRGIDVANCTEFVIEGTRVSSNSGEGIRIASSSTAWITHDLIYANGGNGLLLTTPSSGVTVRVNTFHGNALDQLIESQPGSTGRIKDNVFVAGGGAGIVLANGSAFERSSNLSWANAQQDRPIGNTGTFTADPLFVSPTGADGIEGGDWAADDDFRVRAGSSTLDAGDGSARDFLLSFLGPLSTRTSRADGLPDGGLGDGLPINLGFHYPLELDGFGSLAHGGARIAYAVTDDVVLRTRSWSPSDLTLSEEHRTASANADLRWVEHRVSPVDRPDEVYAALADTGAQAQLLVRTWDGYTWSEGFDSLPTTIRRESVSDRPFDLEYEEASGDALLARAADGGNVFFRVLENGRWAPEVPVFDPQMVPGQVLWVELVPRAGSDEMALAALNEDLDLWCVVWDGSRFGAPTLIGEDLVHTSGWRPFDLAWENQSGNLLITWGFNLFLEETRWATRDHESGAWRHGLHPSTDAIGAHIELASDPTSNRIAAVVGEGDLDNDVVVSVWDGADWRDHTAELTLAAPIATEALEVGWIGDSGIAFAIFRRQGHTGSFNYALFRPTGWKIQPDVVLPGVGRIVKVTARSVPGEDRVLLLVLDEAGKLFALDFDGTKFTRLEPTPLTTLAPGTAGMPFALSVRRD